MWPDRSNSFRKTEHIPTKKVPDSSQKPSTNPSNRCCSLSSLDADFYGSKRISTTRRWRRFFSGLLPSRRPLLRVALEEKCEKRKTEFYAKTFTCSYFPFSHFSSEPLWGDGNNPEIG